MLGLRTPIVHSYPHAAAALVLAVGLALAAFPALSSVSARSGLGDDPTLASRKGRAPFFDAAVARPVQDRFFAATPFGSVEICRQPVAPRTASTQLALLAQSWKDQGLSVRETRDGVFAEGADGIAYSAAADPNSASQILVQKVDPTQRASAGDWPSSFRALLPGISDGADIAQVGEPGKPGFCVRVVLEDDEALDADAIRREMTRRGWLAIHSDAAKSQIVFIREDGTLGCQAMMGVRSDGMQTREIFFSFF